MKRLIKLVSLSCSFIILCYFTFTGFRLESSLSRILIVFIGVYVGGLLVAVSIFLTLSVTKSKEEDKENDEDSDESEEHDQEGQSNREKQES